MTRRTQGSRAERRDQIRARLLEAVEQLLADGENFTELSVERLVSLAGVSRSTFYVYFEDKGELIRAWLTDIISELDVAAQAWWALGPDAGWDDLRAVLGRVVDVYRPHTTLMAAAFDAAAYDTGVRDQVEAMMQRNIAGLRKHIRAGQAAGFVDESLPSAQTAAWLTWMAERGLHRLVKDASDEDLTNLVDAYTSIVWNTLYAQARIRTPRE
ncbi:TetR/AcrR family transcriptional regulator [Pseudonocardia spinosispora]|uniref:TetR/AcrR family transcriptional regulator n=1 Tax=Pseudonocardia spinosispora TaxID=103441 RepID=UPI00041968A2|nr:TetR/AcrR family transcriptional regulator [Pseudonocardia spinosispora]